MLGQGDIVGGRYLLGEPLGEGGMAAVFAAKDLTLERQVAVKLLFAKDERQKDELVERFLREAKMSAAVQHRHVVSIVDFGTTEGQTPFMVMELLEGESLAERLARDTVLGPAEAVELTAFVLRGLAAVHRSAIVHRDLKPDNIFLVEDADGYLPKILDFGISRSVDPGSGRKSAHTTKEGLLVGTPDYMSPEQVRGLSDIDTRTDIYSLGVIMYEALSGQMPFESENVGDLLILIAAGNGVPLSTVAPWIPEALSDVVGRAMARDRKDRYQTAREMLKAVLLAGKELDLPNRMDVTGPFEVVRSSLPPSITIDPIHEVAAAVSNRNSETVALEDEGESPSAFSPTPQTAPMPSVSPATPSRRGRVLLMVGAILGVTLGVAVLMLASAGDEPVVDAPTTAAVAPPSEPSAATVEVRLESLPEGATIRLDGVRTTAPITIVRDDAPHTIEMTHPEHEPWRVTHVASEDAVYTVPLSRLSAVQEEDEGPEVASIEEQPSPRRRGMSRMRRAMSMQSGDDATMADDMAGSRPRTFRDLDY